MDQAGPATAEFFVFSEPPDSGLRGQGFLPASSQCDGYGVESHGVAGILFGSESWHVATAEFPKCAGILSAALSQHHLSGFEIAQL